MTKLRVEENFKGACLTVGPVWLCSGECCPTLYPSGSDDNVSPDKRVKERCQVTNLDAGLVSFWNLWQQWYILIHQLAPHFYPTLGTAPFVESTRRELEDLKEWRVDEDSWRQHDSFLRKLIHITSFLLHTAPPLMQISFIYLFLWFFLFSPCRCFLDVLSRLSRNLFLNSRFLTSHSLDLRLLDTRLDYFSSWLPLFLASWLPLDELSCHILHKYGLRIFLAKLRKRGVWIEKEG